MGIVLDLILIGIVALCVFLGYKRGLVKVVFHLLAFILTLVLTFILYQPVTNFVIKNTQLDESLEKIIIEKGTQNTDLESTESQTNTLTKYINEMQADAQKGVVTSVAGTISSNIIGIGVLITLFIFIRVILLCLSFLADMLAKLPIVKQFNVAGGVLYGLLEGIFIISVILAIIFFFTPIIGNNIENLINQSYITKIVYTNNIILYFLIK